MFLQEEELSIVPERGYERCDRASVIAIKYLEWRSKRDNVDIKHVGNGREEQLWDFHPRMFKCYDPTAQLIGGRAAQDLYDETQERLAELRETLDVEEVWTCEIEQELKKDAEMKEFFEDRGKKKGPIDPRMAYAGGRTGPMKLFAKAEETKKISVYDIVSLYPAVNYETAYPTRLPDIIIPTRDEIEVSWTKPEDLKYKGLYKAKALECGYTVDRFYRAWHYGEDNDDLFKGYIDLEKVKKNAGLRYISKLMLNSLWGKFSMRNSLCKNKVIDQASEFYGLVCDHKIEIHDIVEYSDGAIRVVYKDIS
uniref:DNA-directed DNA polymerase n=1 Tax=Globodera rostochiensis TaxID=31243 RepID=A0A914H7D8_GLORO